MDVTVLTCTGGRPEAFALCELYMARQTRQDFHWIVVDDVEEPTACTMGQTVIRREPFWTPGKRNTLLQNFIVGLEAVTDDGVVVVVEDDDWYAPDWIEFIAKMPRQEKPLVGEGWTIYYHVGFRCFRRNHNSRHASLCATAFRTELIPKIIKMATSSGRPFIDLELFKGMPELARVIDGNRVVGIKGLPGRPGTTKAHATMQTRHEAFDPGLVRLREWIGDDANRYAKFYNPALAEVPRYVSRQKPQMSRRQRRQARPKTAQEIKRELARERWLKLERQRRRQ